VTLALDAASQAEFDRQRTAEFPAGRTAVVAHVTLFHALPGDREAEVLRDVRDVAQRPAFLVSVDRLVPLGRGVAYGLSSPDLAAVHAELSSRWADALTSQDRQPYRPHVTVQNKTTPEHARATLDRLRASFRPYEVGAEGIAVWRYVGGPWEHLTTVHFRGEPDG
jgi:2'-5' RNA ligase